MNFVIVKTGSKVAGQGDAVVTEVAQPCPGLRVIETEGPHRWVEVQRNQSIRPPSHSNQICHPTTITQQSGTVGHPTLIFTK